MQELLNRDDTRLWGLLCNGATCGCCATRRRSSARRTSSSTCEAIFDGELFSDFVLLYLACHESRFAVQGDGGPESCYWSSGGRVAADQGERALDQLRKGVEQAISILGTGFIAHPANPHLRHRLAGDELRLDDLNRALLRLVYRMLFWFVAEDRDALLQPIPGDDVSAETSGAVREARERLRRCTSLRPGSGGWPGGSAAPGTPILRRRRSSSSTRSASEGGLPELALPGIGGIFEHQAPLPGRAAGRCPPVQRGAARRGPRAVPGSSRGDGGALRRVDFGNLGAEELGTSTSPCSS